MNLGGWVKLKLKNIVLLRKVKDLMEENERYRLVNEAFEIENQDAGNRILKLEMNEKFYADFVKKNLESYREPFHDALKSEPKTDES